MIGEGGEQVEPHANEDAEYDRAADGFGAAFHFVGQVTDHVPPIKGIEGTGAGCNESPCDLERVPIAHRAHAKMIHASLAGYQQQTDQQQDGTHFDAGEKKLKAIGRFHVIGVDKGKQSEQRNGHQLDACFVERNKITEVFSKDEDDGHRATSVDKPVGDDVEEPGDPFREEHAIIVKQVTRMRIGGADAGDDQTACDGNECG